MTDKEQLKNGNEIAIASKLWREDPQCVLHVTGEDAADFLQGQFSQELRRRQAGEVAYGFWLTQRGKVMGDARVRREADGAWRIFSDSLTAETLRERLEAYIIADDVELADETADWRGWGMAGEAAMAWLDAMPSTEVAGGWRGMPGGAWGRWMQRDGEPTWPDGWTAGAVADGERLRIGAGWPRVPVDLGPDDLPQEGGGHEAGVSFSKGCYLGQEVMARIAATGRVRRRLVRVAGDGEVPCGEREGLTQAGQTVGELRSRVARAEGGGWLGLAMVALSRVDLAAEATWAEGGGTVCFVAPPSED